MSRVLVRAAALAGTYLLVLTSLAPGDVVIGLVLGLAVAMVLPPANAGAAGDRRAVGAAATLIARTAVEMVRGSWHVVRFCLGAPASPGLVEIPRAGRSREEVALWGLLTGEAPDEVVVDVDESRDVLIVHLVDASDPAAVRARHERNRGHRRKVEAD